jgi:hypothetical protein
MLCSLTIWYTNRKYTKEYVNAAHKNFTPATQLSIWEAKEGLWVHYHPGLLREILYQKRKKKKKPGVFASCPRWGQKIFLFLLLAKTFIDTYCHIKINKNNNKRSHAQQLMPKSIWSIWIIHLNGKLNFIVSKDMGNYFTLAT